MNDSYSREDAELPKLCRAERLQIAGQVAPVLRRRQPRKVTTLDAEGKPVRVVTDIDVAQAALDRLGIEIAVQPGKRPTMVLCKDCKRPRRVLAGAMPIRCRRCAQTAKTIARRTRNTGKYLEVRRACKARERAARKQDSEADARFLEKKRAKERASRAANPEKARAADRIRRAKRREVVNAQTRARYHAKKNAAAKATAS
jgi:hypothetical protein